MGAIRAGPRPEEVQLVPEDARQRPDRCAAASSGRGQEQSLGLDRPTRPWIVDGRGQGKHPRVVAPNLDRDRALPRCRWHDLGREPLGDAVAEPEAVQSCAREHECIGFT